MSLPQDLTEAAPKVYRPQDFPQGAVRFCVPGGIGDISWVYGKLRHLSQTSGRAVILHAPAEDQPQRAYDFIRLLPDVFWGGYLPGRTSWEVHAQSLPAEWPLTAGWGPLIQPLTLNLSANLHLELGRPLREWLPLLPVDYHYPLCFPAKEAQEAAELELNWPKPRIAVYVSNREKERQRAGGWDLWSTLEWLDFLTQIAGAVRVGSFVFLGAEWDRDKTEFIATELRQRTAHLKVATVLGRPLGVALSVLSRCQYCFAYPSGIGVLANVLQVPALMLLPRLLKGLETAYADPVQLATGYYRAWADPRPAEALEWFLKVGSVAAQLD